MKLEYWPNVDVLHIQIGTAPSAEGADAGDPDVTLHFDEQNRISEIEITNASSRVDLNDIRRRYGFEEMIVDEARSAA